MWARAVLFTITALAFSACLGGVESEDCGPTSVLAAGRTPVVATSCAETFSYRGRAYGVECEPVHSSRLGEVFETDGGETEYSGARRIIGVPVDRLFILLGRRCSKTALHLARGEGATIEDFRTARSPLHGLRK